MKTNTTNENNEARQFAIAQIQAVMDAENAKRAASIKAHSEKEAAAAKMEGGRDWSKQ